MMMISIWGIFFWQPSSAECFGTRILYYIVEIPEIMKDPSILWDFKNGYVVYGGIIGGISGKLYLLPHEKAGVYAVF